MLYKRKLENGKKLQRVVVAAKDSTSDASSRITLSVLSIYWLLSWPTRANLRPETRHTSSPTPHYTLACIVWCHSTRKVTRSGCGHTTPHYFFRAMWHHWGCRLRDNDLAPYLVPYGTYYSTVWSDTTLHSAMQCAGVVVASVYWCAWGLIYKMSYDLS